MIRTRGRKIIRDIWARKGRTILVSLAIFIGVAGTIALFSMSDILMTQLREDIQEDKLAMGRIYVRADSSVQLDNVAYLNMIDQFTGVTEVVGGLEDQPVYFKVRPDDERFDDAFLQAHVVLNESKDALVDALPEDLNPIEPVRLIEGHLPTAGTNELAVERRMADEYDLQVGDILYMSVLSPSRNPAQNGATGTTEEWTITAIVFDPYATQPDKSIYTDVGNGTYLAGLTGLGIFWVRFVDFPTAEDNFDSLLNRVANDTPYVPLFSLVQDPANSDLLRGAQILGGLMSFLALVALIVSGFLVVNVISSIVVEQKRQIGVMKSMGASRPDNFGIYSGIAFAYGLIGVIPGVIVGIPGGNAVAHALAPELNVYLEGFKSSPGSVILGIIVGLAVPVLASLLPVFNGTRVTILEAMTDLGIGGNYGSGPVARFINALPLPTIIRQGLSNVSTKKSRIAFTVITLAIAAGVFMGIFAIFQTLTSGIDQYIDSYNVQFLIGPSEARDPDEFKALVLEHFSDDIKSIEEGNLLQVEFEGYDPVPSAGGPPGIFAAGYNYASSDPAFNFDIVEGTGITAETAETGVIFSTKLAASMGKGVGDQVILKVPGNQAELTVVGLAEFPVDQIWMDWRKMSEIAGFTVDKITSTSPISQDMIPPAAASFVKYASLATINGSTQAPNPLVLGITPNLGQYLTFREGGFIPQTSTDGAPPAIIMTGALAEAGNFTVGQTISLTSEANGNTGEFILAGIFDVPPVFGATEGVPTEFIAMYWRDLAAFDGATVESKPRPGSFFVITNKSDPTGKDIDTMIDRWKETLVGEGVPVEVFNFVELTEQISSGFAQIQLILQMVALLIALVGALGLFTTLSMSVFERQKEIGVMRSIGATSTKVAIQFLTEGLVVGIIAWVVGLPIMILIQYLILDITDFIDVFPLEFSLLATIVGLMGMIVITTIASLWPSLSAARKTVSDILRYQ